MRQKWRTIVTIFVVSVVVNYPWEVVQTPLYKGMDDFSRMLWHCFPASLGDGLLVLLIFGVGWLLTGQQEWFINPGGRGYTIMLASGLVIAVAVEWVAVQIAGQWDYSDRMPIIPLLGIGLAPVAQMLLLPPLIFYVVARCAAKEKDSSNSPK